MPNIQARYAADRLDTIETIRIYDGIKPPPPDDLRFTYAVPTIVEELTEPPMVFRDGEFLACEPLGEFEDYWFTPPLGLLPMHLSLHSEVATLPVSFADKGVKECFFKINYWGMAKETVEKVRVLADFGFANREPVVVKGQRIVPRDLLVAMMSDYVPPITDFLAPPKTEPPDWGKEIVTEVRGTKDGKEMTYRLGTLTCKGALPTGVVPARGASGSPRGGSHRAFTRPNWPLIPVPFFHDLENRDIFVQVSVTERV
jgi:lysine 6-dehydrogenase